MLGDASSNVHMQYLRDGVLMTEAEENKLNQTSIRVKTSVWRVNVISSSPSRKKRSILFWPRKTLGERVEIISTIHNQHRWNSRKRWSLIMRWLRSHATQGKCAQHVCFWCMSVCVNDERGKDCCSWACRALIVSMCIFLGIVFSVDRKCSPASLSLC